MTRWEYVVVSWRQDTNWATKRPDEPVTWDETYGISRPGSESWETLPHKSFVDVANELGAEGWELVSQTVNKTTVVRGHGYDEIGAPVGTLWTFKRPTT